jgi:ATP-dependent DNA helicase DinG
MSAVKERLQNQGLSYPLFTMSRSAGHTTEQFKAHPGGVLLATGAAWEGFDFPGDCVSLLIIPRLPFAAPDALKEKKRANHPSLRLFIRAVVVPDMQIKLKQGFGRAIRTETDTCVVAILDERAATGRRYSNDTLTALPEMPVTDSLEDVERFIRSVKGPDYFQEASA